MILQSLVTVILLLDFASTIVNCVWCGVDVVRQFVMMLNCQSGSTRSLSFTG
jgi:hypothetical protein